MALNVSLAPGFFICPNITRYDIDLSILLTAQSDSPQHWISRSAMPTMATQSNLKKTKKTWALRENTSPRAIPHLPRLGVKFPTLKSNALLPGEGRVSNARGMPPGGGGCLGYKLMAMAYPLLRPRVASSQRFSPVLIRYFLICRTNLLEWRLKELLTLWRENDENAGVKFFGSSCSTHEWPRLTVVVWLRYTRICDVARSSAGTKFELIGT